MPASNLREAREKIEIDSMRRKARLDALRDYVTFGATTLGGLGLTILGTSEVFSPETLSIVLSSPETVAGAGIALLGGRKAMKVLSQVAEIFK